MGSASPSVYASGSGKYVYATVTWDEGPEVKVNVNSNGSWRLVKRGDSSKVYLSCSYANSSYSDTFDATDGGEYIFQVYCTAEEQYYNDSFGTSGFTVDFGGDDSGDSGDDGDDSGGSGSDSGGSSSTPYTLTIEEGEGTVITVERTWSDHGPYTSEKYGQIFLSSGDSVYYDADRFDITAEALEGYELDSYYFNGQELGFALSNFTTSSSGKFKLAAAANASVSSTATLKSYTLSLYADEGVTVTVNRISSLEGGVSFGRLENGDTIYHFDELEVTFAAESGYEILSKTIAGEEITEETVLYTVSGETSIEALTRLLGMVHIDNGTTVDRYLCYIDNGESWEPFNFIPYVDNGEGWDMCS